MVQEGHPLAYESRKLNDRERRYSAHEKEIAAIVHCLRPWGKANLGYVFLLKPKKLVIDAHRISFIHIAPLTLVPLPFCAFVRLKSSTKFFQREKTALTLYGQSSTPSVVLLYPRRKRTNERNVPWNSVPTFLAKCHQLKSEAYNSFWWAEQGCLITFFFSG